MKRSIVRRTVRNLFDEISAVQPNRSPKQVLNKWVTDCFFSSNVSTDLYVVLKRFGAFLGPLKNEVQFVELSEVCWASLQLAQLSAGFTPAGVRVVLLVHEYLWTELSGRWALVSQKQPSHSVKILCRHLTDSVTTFMAASSSIFSRRFKC